MRNIVKLLAITASLLMLANCNSTRYIGNYIDDKEYAQIKTSHMSKEEMTEKFGYPTLTETDSRDETWYYISLTNQHSAVKLDKISASRVVSVTFKGGKVVETKLVDNGHKQIAINSDATKTEGAESSRLRDYIRNIGKFSIKPPMRR